MSQENLSNSAGPSCLKRSFGMREAVTITAGSVIGVGLFTTGSNVVGNLGIEVIFATLLALLVSIYPALLYAEMGAALPYAGGTLPICLAWTREGGRRFSRLEFHYFARCGYRR